MQPHKLLSTGASRGGNWGTALLLGTGEIQDNGPGAKSPGVLTAPNAVIKIHDGSHLGDGWGMECPPQAGAQCFLSADETSALRAHATAQREWAGPPCSVCTTPEAGFLWQLWIWTPQNITGQGPPPRVVMCTQVGSGCSGNCRVKSSLERPAGLPVPQDASTELSLSPLRQDRRAGTWSKKNRFAQCPTGVTPVISNVTGGRRACRSKDEDLGAEETFLLLRGSPHLLEGGVGRSWSPLGVSLCLSRAWSSRCGFGNTSGWERDRGPLNLNHNSSPYFEAQCLGL